MWGRVEPHPNSKTSLEKKCNFLDFNSIICKMVRQCNFRGRVKINLLFIKIVCVYFFLYFSILIFYIDKTFYI